MYDLEPLETYDPRVEARVCNLQYLKMLARNNKLVGVFASCSQMVLQDCSLLNWVDGYHQEALLKFMRLEGCRDCGRLTYCPSCLRADGIELGSPLYHCEECLGTKLVCSQCILKHHGCQPFYAIQVRILI